MSEGRQGSRSPGVIRIEIEYSAETSVQMS
jgi:hypothetical protein